MNKRDRNQLLSLIMLMNISCQLFNILKNKKGIENAYLKKNKRRNMAPVFVNKPQQSAVQVDMIINRVLFCKFALLMGLGIVENTSIVTIDKASFFNCARLASVSCLNT